MRTWGDGGQLRRGASEGSNPASAWAWTTTSSPVKMFPSCKLLSVILCYDINWPVNIDYKHV